MKRTHFFIALFALSGMLLWSACKTDKPCVVGSGTTQTYPLNLGVFHSVAISGDMDLELTQDTTIDLTIIAEPEIFQVIDRGILGEVLDLDIEPGVCIETQRGIMVKTTVPNYQKIDISGKSNIVSNGDLNDSDLEIHVSGVATSALTGTVTHQVLDASGTLDIRHFGLNSEVVDIKISGAADIEVYASQELNIDVSGAATVRYKGTPTITENVSGALELIDAN